MTFDQWVAAVGKEALLSSNESSNEEESKVENKLLDMVEEDLMDEES